MRTNDDLLFDCTGLEVAFHPITLDHLKGLLWDALSLDATGPLPVHWDKEEEE